VARLNSAEWRASNVFIAILEVITLLQGRK